MNRLSCMMISDSFLDEQRNIGDVEADKLVASYFSGDQKNLLYQVFAQDDSTIQQKGTVNSLYSFLNTKRPEPDWYQYDRIKNGQLFFKKYALDIMTLLGALSLPYCYAASPGNKALYQTEKIRKATGKRLVETADFIIKVLTPGSFESPGFGYIQINKIRLVHAVARYYVGRDEWDKSWGLPINQEDMSGTNLAFSYIILVGLIRTGFKLSTTEQEDFLYVWRYIGYHMHIHESLLADSKATAEMLERKIRQRHFKPSEEGRKLTQELVNHYKSYFPPVPAFFVDAQMRYLIGPEISALLGMQREPIKDEFLKTMNGAKEMMNQFYNNDRAYETMLANHEKLKQQFMKPNP
jgi:ER-bound oxygenase mpaB/B'/Rubber oxygenase, catalytic domain